MENNVKEMVNNTAEVTANTFKKIDFGKDGYVKNGLIIVGVAGTAYLGYEYILKPSGKLAKKGVDKLVNWIKPKDKVEKVVEKAEEIVEKVEEEIEETLE